MIFGAVTARRGVYLFDEFDALGGDRAGNDVGEARRILNSVLVFLENSSAQSLVIAATNHRSIPDKALVRRLDRVVNYCLPDARQVAVDRLSWRSPRLGGMTGRLADYVEAGYALTPDERLEAARMLRLSVEQDTDSDHAEIDAAWDEVIDRRVTEV